MLEYGKVEVHFMDCVKGMKKIVKTASVQSIITDPPFGIGYDGKQGGYRRKDENVIDGYVEVAFEMYFQFSKRWLQQAFRVLKQRGTCYVFCPHQHVHTVIQAGLSVGFEYTDQLIYVRPFPLYKEKGWVTSHYNIILFTKDEDYLYNMIEKYQKNLLFAERDFQDGDELAPTRLDPQSVFKLIRAATNKQDLILEPFTGSGVVPHCAWLLNRKCVGFELNENMRPIIDSLFTATDITKLIITDNKCPVCGAPIAPYDRKEMGEFRELVKFKCTECDFAE